MKIGPGYCDITLGTNKLFIPHQMIAAAIADPGKKKTYEIV
jgi:hypothetical protein